MGPSERIISYTLQNKSPHEEVFQQLLASSSVNETTDFKAFLAAYKNNNKALLEQIYAANYTGALNEGQTISQLRITLEDNTQIEISDLRIVKLSGYYHTFIQYLVQHGTRSELGKKDDRSPI